MREIPIADWPESRRERKYREMGEREEAILGLITRKGPLNKYGILKHLPRKVGSKPTILEAIRYLKREGIVDVATIDRHARGAKGRSEYYDLTLEGLVELVSRLVGHDDRKELDRILTKYHSLLPPVIDLWTAFVEAGVKDSMVEGLRWFFALHDSWRGSFYRKLNQHPEEALEWLLGPSTVKTVESFFEWAEAIRKDERLRKAAIRAVQYRIEKLKSVEVMKRIQDLTEFVTWLRDPEARGPPPESSLDSLLIHGPV